MKQFIKDDTQNFINNEIRVNERFSWIFGKFDINILLDDNIFKQNKKIELYNPSSLDTIKYLGYEKGNRTFDIKLILFNETITAYYEEENIYFKMESNGKCPTKYIRGKPSVIDHDDSNILDLTLETFDTKNPMKVILILLSCQIILVRL